MRILGPAKRLTVYFGESDRWRGLPLHGALLETLRKDGFAGATVMRGVAGFGAHSRIHSTAILRLSEDLPLVRGDKVQLQQVLLNLIVNAIEAMSRINP